MGFSVPGTIQGQVAAQVRISLGTINMISQYGTLNATFVSAAPNLSWGVGSRVRVTADGSPLTWYMEGTVTVISPGNAGFAMFVDISVGTGFQPNVFVTIAGERGVSGSNGTNGTHGVDSTTAISSSTSIGISIASKTFNHSVINPGWGTGSRVRAYKDASNYMIGVVTSFTSISVTINVDYIVGSGTYDTWTISLTGERGEIGLSAEYTASIISSPSGTVTLARKNDTFCSTTLTNAHTFTIALATPVSGYLNEYIFSFKTGVTLPAITQPGGIKWRVVSPTIAINESWTICYQNIEVSTGVFEIWASAVKAV